MKNIINLATKYHHHHHDANKEHMITPEKDSKVGKPHLLLPF